MNLFGSDSILTVYGYEFIFNRLMSMSLCKWIELFLIQTQFTCMPRYNTESTYLSYLHILMVFHPNFTLLSLLYMQIYATINFFQESLTF